MSADGGCSVCTIGSKERVQQRVLGASVADAGPARSVFGFYYYYPYTILRSLALHRGIS